MKFNFVNRVLNASTEAASEVGIRFGYDAEKFWKSLETMGKGMLGIFIVTGVIILSVMLLNKFTSKK